MNKYLTILFVATFFFACGSGEKSPVENSTPKSAVIDGKKIFKKNCTICHGLYGDMEVNGAKDLNLSSLTKDERIEIITNGKNVMTPFKGVLTPEQIEAVAQYTIDAFQKKE